MARLRTASEFDLLAQFRPRVKVNTHYFEADTEWDKSALLS
jgi:hypothetical protein